MPEAVSVTQQKSTDRCSKVACGATVRPFLHGFEQGQVFIRQHPCHGCDRREPYVGLGVFQRCARNGGPAIL